MEIMLVAVTAQEGIWVVGSAGPAILLMEALGSPMETW